MNIIYMFIAEYNNIKKQEIYFDKNYIVEFNYENNGQKLSGQSLSITKVSNKHKWEFGVNISSVHAIVGKNGTGKSSILELLSTPYQDVKKLDAAYFVIRETEENDKYIIEGKNIYSKGEPIINLFPYFNGLGTPFCFIYDMNETDRRLEIQFSEVEMLYSSALTLRYKSNLRGTLNSAFDIFNSRICSNYNDIDYGYMYKFLHERFHKVISEESHYANAKLVMNLDKLGYYDSHFLFNRERNNKRKEFFEKSLNNIFYILSENYYEKLDRTKFNIDRIKKDMYKLIKSLSDEYNIVSISTEDVDDLINELNKKVINLENIQLLFIEIYNKIYDYNLNMAYNRIITLFKCLSHEKIGNFDYLDIWFKVLEKDYDWISYNNKSMVISLRNLDDNVAKFFNLWNEKRLTNNISHVEMAIRDNFEPGFYGVSDGESYFLKLFSKISQDIFFVNEKSSHIQLLFDEAELYLHPEWCRKLLYYLLKELEQYENEFSIIFATHSPFIISDLPRENVIILNTNKAGECQLDNEVIPKTFGSNIHTLYKEGMFLDATLGEFARQKIKSVVDELSAMKKNNQEYEFDTKEGNMNFDWDKSEYYFNIINNIGDDMIRKLLMSTYNQIYSEREKTVYEKISALTEVEKIKLIKYIKEDVNYVEN